MYFSYTNKSIIMVVVLCSMVGIVSILMKILLNPSLILHIILVLNVVYIMNTLFSYNIKDWTIYQKKVMRLVESQILHHLDFID